MAAESPEQSAACLLDCYSSPNASRPPDVLGTLMLGILAGSKRYAHIAGVRGDAVTAKALGLNGVVSEDSVRRELKAIGGSVGGSVPGRHPPSEPIRQCRCIGAEAGARRVQGAEAADTAGRATPISVVTVSR